MPLSESRKGKVVETLIAAYLILGSDGAVNVSTPLVDDEGVDLVLNLSGEPKHLLLQVKSRFILTKKHTFRANIRRASFKEREDLYLLFVFYDKEEDGLGRTMWLVPSREFKDKTKNQSEERRFIVFSSRFNSNDMWKNYRLDKTDLPDQIVTALKSS
jgi:hypothetical protein